MLRIEAEAKYSYKEKFENIYSKIEMLGGHVHWFKDRDKISDLKIDLTEYGDVDLESMLFSVRGLRQYILMPAIEDNFATDGQRHEWLEDKGEEINEAYASNRLRKNHIGMARYSIDLMRRVFQKHRDARAEECRDILHFIRENEAKENQEKMSVYFADEVARGALQALELLV